jgi:hypothetical protein
MTKQQLAKAKELDLAIEGINDDICSAINLQMNPDVDMYISTSNLSIKIPFDVREEVLDVLKKRFEGIRVALEDELDKL